jgi:hypothetical protein
MTVAELIAQLAPVDLDRQSTIFAYLADHLLESRLMDGSRVLDASDMMMWLRELSHAARMAHASQGKPPMGVNGDRRTLRQTAEQTPRRPFDESCPRQFLPPPRLPRWNISQRSDLGHCRQSLRRGLRRRRFQEVRP